MTNAFNARDLLMIWAVSRLLQKQVNYLSYTAKNIKIDSSVHLDGVYDFDPECLAHNTNLD